MKEIILTIGNQQYDILSQFAVKNNMAPEQYATNILVGWLNGHIKGEYIKKIENETFENLEVKLGKIKL